MRCLARSNVVRITAPFYTTVVVRLEQMTKQKVHCLGIRAGALSARRVPDMTEFASQVFGCVVYDAYGSYDHAFLFRRAVDVAFGLCV